MSKICQQLKSDHEQITTGEGYIKVVDAPFLTGSRSLQHFLPGSDASSLAS